MSEPLPQNVLDIALQKGLYADHHRVLYATNCGDILINHAILNQSGKLILSMNVAITVPDPQWISNHCVSDPITEEQALAVIDRWAKIQEFEKTLDQETKYRI